MSKYFQFFESRSLGWVVQKHGLAILRISQPLTLLARKHSRDMAAHENLGHLSSSGKNYTDRLVGDGFYFTKNGENVARSDSFSAGLIHQGFMKSPGHRENILDPEFEEVGIGAVRSQKKVYYVTQDFLLLFPENKYKKWSRKKLIEIILANINKIRKQAGLSLFAEEDKLTTQAEEIASGIYARRGNMPVTLEPGSGVLYFSSEDPNILLKGTKEKIENDLRNFHRIGIGIVFGKSEEFPNGAFWVAIFLKE